MGKLKRLKVKSSRGIGEKEAMALLLTAATRRGGQLEKIRDEIFKLVLNGQHFGQVTAENPDGEALSDVDKKKIVTVMNADFKKRSYAYRIRYVASVNGIVFAPLAKMKELFGTREK